jgi:hypothetical protein
LIANSFVSSTNIRGITTINGTNIPMPPTLGTGLSCIFCGPSRVSERKYLYFLNDKRMQHEAIKEIRNANRLIKAIHTPSFSKM